MAMPPPISQPIEIDALVLKGESGAWIAQCIQYDIVAHAASLPALPKAIELEVVANLCINAKLGRNGLDGIQPDPQKYHDEFREATLGLSPSYKFWSLSSNNPVHLGDYVFCEPCESW